MSQRTRTRSGQQRELLRAINQSENDERIYAVIGVDESYTILDVERAFRKISLQIHPDKNKISDKPDAEKAIKKVGNAIDKLKIRIEGKARGRRKEATRGNSAAAKAARENAAKEKAAKEKAAKEKAAREKAAREEAAREKAAREEAAREKAAREEAARENAAKEEAARTRARERAAREEAARARAQREASGTQDGIVTEEFKRKLGQMVRTRLSNYDSEFAQEMAGLAELLISASFQSDVGNNWLQLGLMGLFVYLKLTEK